jgi:glycosyltransferase involved in cell wall biosynthesis
MYTPKVSVGLPVYNGEKYLRVALDSILQQDYRDFELIISDNASQDTTAEICRDYAAKDVRVRYHRFEVNQGASRNFRFVFEMARGEYFKWAAYDDVCLPGFLRSCVEALDRAPSAVVVVVPRARIIDQIGQAKEMPVPPECSDIRTSRPHQRLAEVLRTVSWAPSQYGLIRVEALRKTRLIEPFFASDRVLVAELALLGEIWETPRTLLELRFHPQISTLSQKRPADLLSWFDPSQPKRKRFLPPFTRIGVEYVRSIGRIELPFTERLLCYLTVIIVWCPIEVRRLIQELRNKMALGTRIKRFVRRWSVEHCRNLL